MKTEKSLKSRALEILARRETSRLELRRKLAPHAADEAELEQVLDEVAAANWQSDERFTEMWVNGKSRKHGRMRLQQELAAKGVDREMIRHYLPDAESELENAVNVLRKKFRQPAADAAERNKQMRFLIYRGFGNDTAQAALRQAWAEEAE